MATEQAKSNAADLVQPWHLERWSKWISWALRHAPAEAGIPAGWPDAEGWVRTADLLRAAPELKGLKLTPEILEHLVASNAKKRFETVMVGPHGDGGHRIRASQGHSFDVDLSTHVQEPPEFLFHGTATRFVESIRAQGILRGERQHVHLSDNLETATSVGSRHGRPVVLRVRALGLHRGGEQFMRSTNGVWLADHIPSGAVDWDALLHPVQVSGAGKEAPDAGSGNTPLAGVKAPRP